MSCALVSLRANDKTDVDVLRENHRFLWRDEDEEDMTWWVYCSCRWCSFSVHLGLFLYFPLKMSGSERNLCLNPKAACACCWAYATFYITCGLMPFQGEGAGQEVLRQAVQGVLHSWPQQIQGKQGGMNGWNHLNRNTAATGINVTACRFTWALIYEAESVWE